MIVYKATCEITNKSYIGCTSQKLKQRISQHKHRALKQCHNLKFDNAIRKYGFESFSWEILDEFNLKDRMFLAEIKYISEYDTFNSGYNSSFGGESSTIGRVVSNETKRKMSLSSKGKGFKPSTTKYWKVTKPCGDVIHVNDRVQFCKVHGLNYGSVRSATHRGKSYKRYKFDEVKIT